jgi:hypothetical protein
MLFPQGSVKVENNIQAAEQQNVRPGEVHSSRSPMCLHSNAAGGGEGDEVYRVELRQGFDRTSTFTAWHAPMGPSKIPATLTLDFRVVKYWCPCCHSVPSCNWQRRSAATGCLGAPALSRRLLHSRTAAHALVGTG